MAEYINIPLRTWANYENGKTEPRVGILMALAEKGHTIPGLTTGLAQDLAASGKVSLEELAACCASRINS